MNSIVSLIARSSLFALFLSSLALAQVESPSRTRGAQAFPSINPELPGSEVRPILESAFYSLHPKIASAERAIEQSPLRASEDQGRLGEILSLLRAMSILQDFADAFQDYVPFVGEARLDLSGSLERVQDPSTASESDSIFIKELRQLYSLSLESSAQEEGLFAADSLRGDLIRLVQELADLPTLATLSDRINELIDVSLGQLNNETMALISALTKARVAVIIKLQKLRRRCAEAMTELPSDADKTDRDWLAANTYYSVGRVIEIIVNSNDLHKVSLQIEVLETSLNNLNASEAEQAYCGLLLEKEALKESKEELANIIILTVENPDTPLQDLEGFDYRKVVRALEIASQ